jgi:hypothetical protein
MSNSVVTSFSADGWKQYGERFLESFDQYWPTEVDLHVVSEDLLAVSLNSDRTVFNWSLLADSSDARDFLTRHRDNLWVHGDASVPRPFGLAAHWRPDSGQNCFRHDAYKFCKKVFAVELVSRRTTGRLLWIDADVVTFAPVPIELCYEVLPGGYAMSGLVRQGYHSECGFIGYNLDNPAALSFIRAFADLYASDKVFELAEWHDSWVWDWLRNKMQTHTYEIPHRSKAHPFINSVLGQYMDHLKGKRKKRGYSLPNEQLKYTQLAYWQR